MNTRIVTIVCVEWGDYLQRGAEYVNKLHEGCKRNMPGLFKFVVLTDDPRRHASKSTQLLSGGKEGWWNKVELFNPARFTKGERLLFLDLDVLVTGDLLPVIKSKGILHLRDWGFPRDVYCSGTMAWDAGEHEEIWKDYSPLVAAQYKKGGDQEWITSLGGWERLDATLLRSYRHHCKEDVPEHCSVVAFHGKPKPHEVENGWAKDMWESL